MRVDASKLKEGPPKLASLSRRLTSLRRAKMATTPYTVVELRARRKKLGDFNFVKQIADLLNAMETEIDKRQELLDAYRKAARSPDDPKRKSFWRSFGKGGFWHSNGNGGGEK